MSANQIHRVKAKTTTPSTLVAKTEENFVDVTTEENFPNVTTEGFEIVIQDCIRISKTCPVWTLKKCIDLCPIVANDPRVCSTDYIFCGYVGDSVDVTYNFTPTKLSEGSFYISGTVIVTNTTLASKSIVIRDIRIAGTTYSVTTQPNVKFGLSVLSKDTLAIEFIGLLPFNPCSTTTVDVSLEYIVLGVTRVFLIKIPIDCTQKLLCPCDESGTLQITDTDNFGKITVTNNATSKTKYTVTKNFLVGDVDSNGPFCNSLEPFTDTATLEFVPKNPEATPCGPTICPVKSEENAVTVNCNLPTVEATVSIDTVYTSNWCVCKSGEIVKPCPTPTACTYSHGYWKNHGPNSVNSCEDCSKSDGVNAYPLSVQTDGLKVYTEFGGKFINEFEVCALLKVTTSTISCISNQIIAYDTAWNNILPAIKQYIAALLNVQKLKADGFSTTCIDSVLLSAGKLLYAFFSTIDSNGKYGAFDNSNGPVGVFGGQSSVDDIISLISVLDAFNTSSLDSLCPSFSHCGEPSTPCELPGCTAKYVKWTVDLSGATTYKSTSTVNVVLTPSFTCIPDYEKVFNITINRSGSSSPITETITVPAKNTLISFPLVLNVSPPFVTGELVNIVVSYNPQTFSTTTCAVTETTGALPIIIYNSKIAPTVTCVAGSTSKLTDVVSFAGSTAACSASPKIAGLNFPCDQIITDKCIQQIRDNTQLVIKSSKYDPSVTPATVCSASAPIKVGLCTKILGAPTNDTLTTLLGNMISGKVSLNIDDLLKAFVQGFDVCAAPRCYDMLNLTFYTEIPECACSVTNTATVTTEPISPRIGPSSSSFSSVTINAGKPQCTTSLPITTRDNLINASEKVISNNMVPKFVKRR